MTPRPSALDKLADWIDGLPEWARPVAYGAGFIVVLMGYRGAFLALPVLIGVLLFKSPQPLPDLLRVVLVLGMAVTGGGLSGAAYSLMGRYLRRISLVGPYLAGVVTTLPYMAVVILIVRLLDREPVFQSPTPLDLGVLAFMSLLFGPLVGHVFFRVDPAAQRDARAA